MSTDGLDPIRRVYGVPSEAEVQPDANAANTVEQELLASSKELLDAWPRTTPPQEAVDAVCSAAMQEVYRPLLEAYGESEQESLQSGDARLAERELIRTTKEALDTLPNASADSSVLEAVKSAAATQALVPVRLAYGVDLEGATVEPGSTPHVEYELLASTKHALEQLPRHRPDASILRAVTSAAVPGAPVLRVASDRSPKRKEVRRKLVPALAWAASFVLVAISGIWVINQSGIDLQEQNDSAELADQVIQQEAPVDLEGSEDARSIEGGQADQAYVPGGPTATPQRAEATTGAQSPLFGRERAAEARLAAAGNRQEEVLREGAPVSADIAMASQPVVEALGDTNMPSSSDSDWNAGEDVRLLSLRLQQLANSNEGLEWGDEPSAFGAADSSADIGATGGFRTAGAPVRGNVQVRSNRDNN